MYHMRIIASRTYIALGHHRSRNPSSTYCCIPCITKRHRSPPPLPPRIARTPARTHQTRPSTTSDDDTFCTLYLPPRARACMYPTHSKANSTVYYTLHEYPRFLPSLLYPHVCPTLDPFSSLRLNVLALNIRSSGTRRGLDDPFGGRNEAVALFRPVNGIEPRLDTAMEHGNGRTPPALYTTLSSAPCGEVVATQSSTRMQSYPRKYASTSVPSTHCPPIFQVPVSCALGRREGSERKLT